MYQEHPVFDTPGDDAVLWRYMDFTKFVSLLETSALHFARADKLGDPFEGARSPMNRVIRPLLYGDKIPAESFEWFDNYSRELRAYTFVSCWHESAHESAALWKLYAHDSQGVAVKTSCSGLKGCFSTDDTIYIGRLRYVDFDQTPIPERNSLAPFTYKRQEFAHEHEVRAVIRHEPNEELLCTEGRTSSDGGLYYRASLDTLIREVRIAPYAPDWYADLVRRVTKARGLSASVEPSSLSREPEWILS